jgi:hypothetical protein
MPPGGVAPPRGRRALPPRQDAMRNTQQQRHAGRAKAPAPPPAATGGRHGVTVILCCVGVGLLAVCFLIPQADRNRALAHQALKLQLDLEYLDRQTAANAALIEKIAKDPVLAERLAQRQMKFARKGASVLDLEDGPSQPDASPFSLVVVAPPPRLKPAAAPGGRLADLARDPRKRLYTVGVGLMLVAVGLVVGVVKT